MPPLDVGPTNETIMPQTYTLPIPTIRCAGCVNTLRKLFEQLDGCACLTVEVNHDQAGSGGYATVEIDETILTLDTLFKRIEGVGHEAVNTLAPNGHVGTATTEADAQLHQTERYHWYRALAAGSLGVMLLFLPMLGVTLPLSAMAIVAALATITSVYAGFDIFKQGLKQLWKGRTMSMDTLFALSTATALAMSFAAFFIPSLSMHFETALLIFSSRHLGNFLELRMKNKINTNLRFQSMLPKQVTKLEQCPARGIWLEKIISLEDVVKGDTLKINQGMIIPVDGELVSKQALIYQTIINGKLHPEYLTEGSPLSAGMRVADGETVIKVLAPVQYSHLAKLDKALDAAKQKKTHIETHAEKIIQYFVPAVLLSATLALIIGLSFFSASTAIHSALSILVGACPCTLGFITPLAVRVGLANSAQGGAIIAEPQAIEQSSHIKTIVFDLNGTLTEGAPRVENVTLIDPSKDTTAIAKLIIDLEGAIQHRHPAGEALLSYAYSISQPNPNASSRLSEITYQNQPGITANLNGNHYALGNYSLMKQLHITASAQAQRIYLAENNKVIAYFDLHDPLRKDAKTTVQRLRQLGYQIALCTGADATTATHYAKKLNIPHVIAACHGGLQKQQRLQEANLAPFAMVGDAANDTLALKSASIGIATADAADISKAHADVLIDKNHLHPLVSFFENARYTLRTIKQNLAISLGYNLLLMVGCGLIAMQLGPIAPGVMALMMGIQSIAVLGNTYRLKQQRYTEPLVQELIAVKEELNHTGLELKQGDYSPQAQQASKGTFFAFSLFTQTPEGPLSSVELDERPSSYHM